MVWWKKSLDWLRRGGRQAVALSDTASRRIAAHQARMDVVEVAKEALKQEIAHDPALRRRAAESLLELRREKEVANTEAILARGAELAIMNAPRNTPTEDWLYRFIDNARTITEGDVQELMSRIMAGEFNSPGRFSPNTLAICGRLDQTLLTAFQKVCNLSLFNGDRAFVILMITSLKGNPRKNISEVNIIGRMLEPFGVSHQELLELFTLGLLNSARDGQEYPDPYEILKSDMDLAGVPIDVDYSARRGAECDSGDAINVISFSRTGNELRSVTPMHPNLSYRDALIEAADK